LRSALRPSTLIACVVALAVTGLGTTGIAAASSAAPSETSPTQAGAARHIQLWDGSTVTLGPGGIGTRTRPGDGDPAPVSMVLPHVHSALGDSPGPSDLAIRTDFAQRDHAGTTSDVVLGLAQAVADDAPLPRGSQGRMSGARAPRTTSATVNAALRQVGATSLVPLFAGESPSAMAPLMAPRRLVMAALMRGPATRHITVNRKAKVTVSQKSWLGKVVVSKGGKPPALCSAPVDSMCSPSAIRAAS